MPSRVAHFKSHHGCLQCKKRRVKCNEGIPCQNCFRRSEACSLAYSSPPVTGLKSGTSGFAISHKPYPNKPDASSFLKSNSQNQTPFLAPATSIPTQLALPTFSSNRIEDLHLIHHYTTATYSTLVERPHVSELWRTYVPQEAITNPYLMHGILMLSASHLRHLHPEEDQKYLVLARHHQERALEPFQKAIMKIDAVNCGAVFAFAATLSIFSMTAITLPVRRREASIPISPSGSKTRDWGPMRGPPPTPRPTLSDIDELAVLTRGVKDIIETAFAYIHAMPLSIMFEKYSLDDYSTVRLPARIQAQLDSLRAMVPQFCSNNADREACETALARLEETYKDCLAFSSLTGVDASSTRSPLKVIDIGVVKKYFPECPSDFVVLLRMGHTAALVLLAHYAVLFKFVEDKWYLQDMAERMFGAVEDSIEEDGRRWIEWPGKTIKDNIWEFVT